MSTGRSDPYAPRLVVTEVCGVAAAYPENLLRARGAPFSWAGVGLLPSYGTGDTGKQAAASSRGPGADAESGAPPLSLEASRERHAKELVGVPLGGLDSSRQGGDA
jgi:hypothetical protein